MGNLIVPPNWVNSTNFKMSSAASLRLVKTEPKTVFPTIFCFILGLLSIILGERGPSAIDLGPRIGSVGIFSWVCGSGPFVSPMEDAIAHGAAFSFLVYHSNIFLFLFEEGGDVGYILEEKNQHRFQIKIHRIIKRYISW